MKFITKIAILLSFLVLGKIATAQVGVAFDGSQDQIIAPNQPNLEFTTGTIECWIRPIFSSANQAFIAMRSNGAGTSRFSFHINVNSNYIGLWNGLTWQTLNMSGGITAGTWYHVALKMTTTSTEIIWNGVSQGTTTNGINTANTGRDFSIGSPNDNTYPGEYFNGSIDDVRIWNTSRTITEINDNMNICLQGNETGLVAFYNFDENEGTTATDLTANANNGTLQFDATWGEGVTCGETPNGSIRMVLNNNAYVVMNDTTLIVIDNDQRSAITEINGGGMIISEDENNEVIWHINENSGGTYVVPFGTKPVVQGGNGTKIPVSVAIDTAGIQSTSGSIAFSTWETPNDDNTPYPWSVTNAEDGLKAVDRYWGLYPENYTSNPAVSIQFTYDDAANEIGGTNTLVEANLVAQHYDNSIDRWQNVQGTVNTTVDTVGGVAMNTTDFNSDNWLWTLVDASNPLPIDMNEFTIFCDNNNPVLSWELTSNTSIDKIIIENSVDGKNWIEVEEASNNNLANKWNSNGDEYGQFYRLKVISEAKGIEYSQIQKADCNADSFEVALYPNPATNVVYMNIQGSDKTSLNIYESTGKLVIQNQLGSVLNHTLDVSNLSRGMNYFKFSNEEGIVKSFKLNLIK